MLSLKPPSFVQSFFDMQAPRWLYVFLFPFVYLEMSLFPFLFFCTIAVFSLYGEYVVRFFLPDGVFLLCDHGQDFFTSAYVIIQSNSIKKHYYRLIQGRSLAIIEPLSLPAGACATRTCVWA